MASITIKKIWCDDPLAIGFGGDDIKLFAEKDFGGRESVHEESFWWSESSSVIDKDVDFDQSCTISLWDKDWGLFSDTWTRIGWFHVDTTAIQEATVTLQEAQGAIYRVTYSVQEAYLERDGRQGEPPQELDPAREQPTNIPEPDFGGIKSVPGNFAADKPTGVKWILTLDGGGTRGILTLQALRALETFYGHRVDEMFDMYAGTSTGSIIVAALARGYTVAEIIALYENQDTRNKLFETNEDTQKQKFRNLVIPGTGKTLNNVKDEALGGIWAARAVSTAAGTLAAGVTAYVLFASGVSFGIASIPGAALALSAIAMAGLAWELWTRFDVSQIEASFENSVKEGGKALMVPKFRDRAKFTKLDELLSTLTLAQCQKDILITTKDLVRGETIFFSKFTRADGTVVGNFPNLKLAGAVKASTAAPTYFPSVGQMVDGGVGAFNNPCFAAAMEALYYSSGQTIGRRPLVADGPYEPGKVEVWSFGTGGIASDDSNATFIPDGTEDILKRTDALPFWIQTLIEDAFYSANDQQTFLCRDYLDATLHSIRFRRFNIFYRPGTENFHLDAYRSDYVTQSNMALGFAEKLWNDYFLRLAKAKEILADPNSSAVAKSNAQSVIDDLQHGLEIDRPNRNSFMAYAAEVRRKLNTASPVL